jgi:glycosyltransferase involved in cell wall biosynthesis
VSHRVLIDVNPALKPQVTGVGIYTAELVRHLHSLPRNGFHWGFYYNRERLNHTVHLRSMAQPEQIETAFHDGVSYRCRFDEFGKYATGWVGVQSWLPLTAGKWSLFHATNLLLPPLPRRTRAVTTIHDVIPCRLPAPGTDHLRERWMARAEHAVQRADCVIAVSESTAADLQTYFHVEPAKIRVIHQGVDDEPIQWMSAEEKAKARKRFSLPERYVLYVGTLSVHKNVLNLIKAFLKIRDAELGLLIVGRAGDQASAIQDFLDHCPDRSRIRLLGYASRGELETLYQLATVFVFPSLYEGFGLPVLEAMKRRVPVVTSDNSSLRELFHDAAVLVDPAQPDDIANAVEGMLQDERLRRSLVEQGERKSAALTWKTTAEQTHAVYESLV